MDGMLVYAADTDNDALLVFDAATLERVAMVPVGPSPLRVEVGHDDTVYVANRRGRSISVIRRGDWRVAASVATGIDPVALRTSEDGATLYVVSTVAPGRDYGTLAAIDTRTLTQRWELPIGDEPRGLALTKRGRAIVTLMRVGATVVVDLEKQRILRRQDYGEGTFENTPRTRLTTVTDVATSDDATIILGQRVPTNVPDAGLLVSNGVEAEWATNGALVTSIAPDGAPIGARTTGVGATVGVLAGSGRNSFQLVVNREASTVTAALPNGRTLGVIAVGAGADGIAVASNRREAFVYSQFDHELSKLVYRVYDDRWVSETRVRGADDVLPAQVTAGRRLFHDASISLGSVACSSCHVEGRDDGHVWMMHNGPRQTPTLAGRFVSRTAPIHWAGEFSEMSGFYEHTVKSLMGGRGLDETEQRAITAFIEALPAPENPYAQTALGPQEQRGLIAFQKAECGTCHGGVFLTLGKRADVGTAVLGGDAPDSPDVVEHGLDTPSLLGLSRSAPYLHDGSAKTLSERLERQRGDEHGKLSVLTEVEFADLVAYLRTL